MVGAEELREALGLVLEARIRLSVGEGGVERLLSRAEVEARRVRLLLVAERERRAAAELLASSVPVPGCPR